MTLKRGACLRWLVISYQPAKLSTTMAFRKIRKLFGHCANVNPTLENWHLNRFAWSTRRDAEAQLQTMFTYLSVYCPYKGSITRNTKILTESSFTRDTKILAEAKLTQHRKDVARHFVDLQFGKVGLKLALR